MTKARDISAHTRPRAILPCCMSESLPGVYSKMSLARFPYEVVLDIVDMCHPRDIISWSQTSRLSCNLLLPALYRSNIMRQKSSALFWAVENNKPILTTKILQYHKADINAVHDQSTPFIRAAEFGSESVINILTTT